MFGSDKTREERRRRHGTELLIQVTKQVSSCLFSERLHGLHGFLRRRELVSGPFLHCILQVIADGLRQALQSHSRRYVCRVNTIICRLLLMNSIALDI